MDHRLLKGLPFLQQDPARFFSEIDEPRHGPGFLGEVAAFLEQIERHDLARGVEELSRTLHGSPDAAG